MCFMKQQFNILFMISLLQILPMVIFQWEDMEMIIKWKTWEKNHLQLNK
jgi:hypothetical protein